MASFIGTNKEFRRYIGPRLRNLVQQITKNHKATISVCEHCGSKENLESAHVRGKDRNEIIDLLLNKYTNNNIITVDISLFEDQFKEEHHPLEKAILILCRSCHRKYDSKKINSTPSQKEESNQSDNYNSDSYLPITLEPPDPDLFKQELLTTKKAEIETTYSNGKVENKIWNADRFSITSNVFGNLRSRPEYRSGKWQTKGIIKVHVRIIKNAQQEVQADP